MRPFELSAIVNSDLPPATKKASMMEYAMRNACIHLLGKRKTFDAPPDNNSSKKQHSPRSENVLQLKSIARSLSQSDANAAVSQSYEDQLRQAQMSFKETEKNIRSHQRKMNKAKKEV
jgi:hypothetical protein